MKVTIRKQSGGGTWGVFVDGRLLEGGFFSRSAAEQCAAEFRTLNDI